MNQVVITELKKMMATILGNCLKAYKAEPKYILLFRIQMMNLKNRFVIDNIIHINLEEQS